MAIVLNDLIASMEKLSICDIDEAQARLFQLISGVNNVLQDIHCLLEKQSTEKWNITARLSFETSTHFKWRIYETNNKVFQLFLHEYKQKDLMRPGYAITPHNHRYWFASRIINGGFNHIKYSISEKEKDSFNPECVSISENRLFSRDDAYQLKVGEIHSLNNIDEKTITLVVQSHPIREYSEEYRLDSGRVIKHIPTSSRQEKLLSLLKSVY